MIARAIVFLLLFPVFSRAQDYSNFLVPNGFHLPTLRSGQYIVTVTPRYSNRPSDNASSSVTANPVSSTISTFNSSYSEFRIGSTFTYGLSDVTTLSVALDYIPGQSAGNTTSTYNSISQSFAVQGSSVSENRDNWFSPSFVLSHRMQRNIELSLVGYWSASTPSNSTIDNSGGTIRTGVSSANSRAFDIQASLVILGN